VKKQGTGIREQQTAKQLTANSRQQAAESYTPNSPMKKNSQSLWTKIDHYFGDLFAPHDENLVAAIKANRAAHMGRPAGLVRSA
jgi:hypothetical protein